MSQKAEFSPILCVLALASVVFSTDICLKQGRKIRSEISVLNRVRGGGPSYTPLPEHLLSNPRAKNLTNLKQFCLDFFQIGRNHKVLIPKFLEKSTSNFSLQKPVHQSRGRLRRILLFYLFSLILNLCKVKLFYL